MIYGDKPQDPLGLGVYVPNINAIRQSGNLYVYCGGNPVLFIDATGEAWWHWAIGAAIVIGAGIAVVATAGGALPAVAAVLSVAYGAAATTAGATIAAGAFIGAAATFAVIAFDAATTSKSIKDFNASGNWEVVAFTAGGLLVGGAYGYTLYQNNKITIAERGSTGGGELKLKT